MKFRVAVNLTVTAIIEADSGHDCLEVAEDRANDIVIDNKASGNDWKLTRVRAFAGVGVEDPEDDA